MTEHKKSRVSSRMPEGGFSGRRKFALQTLNTWTSRAEGKFAAACGFSVEKRI